MPAMDPRPGGAARTVAETPMPGMSGPAMPTVSCTGPPAQIRRAAVWTAGLLVALASLELLFGLRPGIETLLLLNDVQPLAVLVVILLLAAWWRAPGALALWIRAAEQRRIAALIALIAAVLCVAGTDRVFQAYPLSYDEVMAGFDAAIFRSGRLIASVPPEWRGFQHALAPSFLLPIPNDAAWVSGYLPVNAALRALVGSVLSPTLTGPLLLVIAVLALNGIARHLWPERPDAALVAVLLMVTAPQVLLTAMTPYAMTAHLAFNLLWLRLFLRGGVIGHGGAAVIGALACGLHQLVFHPLFAAPFILLAILERRWLLTVFYGAVYAGAALFWILYWQVLLAATGHGAGEAAALGAPWFLQRVAALLGGFDLSSLDLMAKNLLRFAAWQSPLLLPLMALAWPALRRGERLVWPLAAGIGLTLLAVTVLLPFQGHGWGYRYLHGLIGSACLLAARGWIALTERATAGQASAARAAFGGCCLAAILVLVPVRASDVHGFVAPYAAASRAIAATDADIVAVRAGGALYARDLVRNDPILRNRPIVVLLDDLDPAKRAALCARGRVFEFGPSEARDLGILGDYRAEAIGTSPNELPCSAGRVATR
jgi:hypothetical protein